MNVDVLTYSNHEPINDRLVPYANLHYKQEVFSTIEDFLIWQYSSDIFQKIQNKTLIIRHFQNFDQTGLKIIYQIALPK